MVRFPNKSFYDAPFTNKWYVCKPASVNLSHQFQKSTISTLTRCTDTIETTKYSVFTAGIRLLKSNFLAAVPFASVVPWCCVRTESDVITKTKISRIDSLPHFLNLRAPRPHLRRAELPVILLDRQGSQMRANKIGIFMNKGHAFLYYTRL